LGFAGRTAEISTYLADNAAFSGNLPLPSHEGRAAYQARRAGDFDRLRELVAEDAEWAGALATWCIQ
jgi:hypothetical protein